MNILFIMCDQLRWDYLSCYGHPHLQTPHIDRLAKMGVRFERAYVQAPVCGPSRASMYTGRYVASHGASLNFAPLSPSELFLGDYLGELGVKTAVVGKTHLFPDLTALQRLGITLDSAAGQRVAAGAFEEVWRDDGVHPDPAIQQRGNIEYNQYLHGQGYDGKNPWHRHANGAINENGEWVSGWFNENCHLPADIAEAHSETPYTTSRAIQFIEQAGSEPWCLHLSYIKPHWPYIAPAPYHARYGQEAILPPSRTEQEKATTHPVYAAYQRENMSTGFANDAMRERVLPAYMGLVKQVDDQIGRLLAFLEARGDLDQTMILFTSDHGDYLGDHWLGDKTFIHETAVRVPLILVDPRSEANGTRGTVCHDIVESIDYVATFVEAMGGMPDNRQDGRSLLPLLHSQTTSRPPYAISEIDFANRQANDMLNLPPTQCRIVIVITKRWKYATFNGFRPMLFDLQDDPEELNDLGEHPDYEAVRQEMESHLADWALRRNPRVAVPDGRFEANKGQFSIESKGIYIGYWNEAELKQKTQRRIDKESK